MTRSRDSGSIPIVTLAGQKIAGYQVVSIMAEQALRREQPRRKVRVSQLLLPVGHAEAFVLRAGGGKAGTGSADTKRAAQTEGQWRASSCC